MEGDLITMDIDRKSRCCRCWWCQENWSRFCDAINKAIWLLVTPLCSKSFQLNTRSRTEEWLSEAATQYSREKVLKYSCYRNCIVNWRTHKIKQTSFAISTTLCTVLKIRPHSPDKIHKYMSQNRVLPDLTPISRYLQSLAIIIASV